MKRQAVGIWKCKACQKTVAGGAWTVTTTAAATVRRYVTKNRCLLTHLTMLLQQYRPSVARADRGISYSIGLFRHALFSHLYLSSSHACKTTSLWYARIMLSQDNIRICVPSH